MGDRVELMKQKKEDLKEAYGSMSKEASILELIPPSSSTTRVPKLKVVLKI